MSSEDDQLCLNISSGDQVPTTFSPKRHKWSKRKQGAEKRTLSCSSQDSRCSSKQRRLVKDDVKEGGKESGSTNIKTSSLFKHNPDIPDISRPAVAQLKEEIFTSDCFSGLNLHPHLVATLEKVLNVSTLTSVQKQTIPQLLAGRDAVVRSQTGSGKTLSYAVPMVQSLQASQPRVQRSDGPLALVIVPTRELALQTLQTFQKLLKPFTWIVPGVLMGGEKRKSEKARLRKGINILVSTPGRLVDHIKNTLSITFSSVRWLVLDEADRTLDLGFEKDLTVILNSLNKTGVKRQNVLLSATLTHGVTRLVDVCLKDPVSVQVCRSASSDPDADSLAAAFEPSTAGQADGFAVPEALQQFVVMVPSKLRLVCLASFLLGRCKDKVIVFVSSCECVEFLHSLLTSVLSSTAAAANHQPRLNFLRLHGNMKQEERSLVYQNFSESASGVLLCTDVAARGLHLPQVTWIVQYTPPAAAAEYVHRVGRTARIGGGGSSLLFLAPSESLFISELANHSVSLSEMKLSDILSTLMTDDTYKGRGKYHSKTSSKALEQETRERATVLQTHFENFVHADAQRLQSAKKALQSFLRAYTTFPAALKHIFHIRALHLGHVAKSFGLRDAPQHLSAADAKQPSHKKQSGRQDRKQQPGHKRLPGSQREVRLLRSEFSSGLEADDTKKTKKKKKKMTLSEEEEQ